MSSEGRCQRLVLCKFTSVRHAAEVPYLSWRSAENGCFLKPRGTSQEWISAVAGSNLSWKGPCIEMLQYVSLQYQFDCIDIPLIFLPLSSLSEHQDPSSKSAKRQLSGASGLVARLNRTRQPNDRVERDYGLSAKQQRLRIIYSTVSAKNMVCASFPVPTPSSSFPTTSPAQLP